MDLKKSARLRRAKRTPSKISELSMHRLCGYRTPRHIYAQIISAQGDQILASASTVEKENRKNGTSNVEAASTIGQLIAKRSIEAGIDQVAFDRSGYAYHGRVKALAEAARESGLKF